MVNSILYSWHSWQKFLHSSGNNKRHILLVVIMSAATRFSTLYLPFRWLSPWLGIHKRKLQFCTLATPQQIHIARRTGAFIERVCERMPWQSKCLVRAVILRYYLDQYQIPYVLHIGLAKGEENSDKPLLAHAWINVGPLPVVGGEGHQAFTVISTYVSKSICDKIIE